MGKTFAYDRHLEMLRFFQDNFRFKGIVFTSSPLLVEKAQAMQILTIRRTE